MKWALCLMLTWLASCSAGGGPPLNAACQTALGQPITIGATEQLESATARQILTHNRLAEELCGLTPPTGPPGKTP